MKRVILAGVLALSMSMTGLMAQKKGPAPKSQKEGEALQALFSATDPDSRIKAGEFVLNKFADSEFKPFVTYLLAASYEEKNDYEKTVFWAERTIQEDPKNYQAMLMLSTAIPRHSQEHDLDLDEKLAKADKYAKTAMDLVPKAEKPNPQTTDAQWANAKKDMIAQAHEAFGMIANLRKKYDVAVTEFKLATGPDVPNIDPTTEIRLAQAYNMSGKPDEAIALLDKVTAKPDLPVQLKQYAQAERVRAVQSKGGAKPAAAPAAATPAAPKN